MTLKSKNILAGGAIFTMIVVLGGAWLFMKKDGGSPDPIPKGDTSRPDDGKKPDAMPPPPQAIKLPADFGVLDESHSMLKGETRTKTITAFNSLAEDIKKDPSDLHAWNSFGAIKKMFGDYKGAEQAWLFALSINSTFTDAYANLGQLYWHYLIDYPKTEKMFLAVIKNNPAIISAYTNLSDLYRYNYTEKKTEADKILLKGLENNPEQADLLSALASYYYDEGRRDLAINFYERLVKADPGNKQAKKDLEALRAGNPIGLPD
ncbi:MAG: hypothetical protein EXS68_02455 [Candidatus Ryanbacteria bacterium]|nr:hypothetical protein [Candidatus Ryanbacteria bacterium]